MYQPLASQLLNTEHPLPIWVLSMGTEMTIFDDLFAWVDADPDRNRVHTCMSAVYDKANREEATESSPVFAACTQRLFHPTDLKLSTQFSPVVLSHRVHRHRIGLPQETGRTERWKVQMLRDGTIEMAQYDWRIDWRRLTQVQRLDVGSGDFAIGFWQNASTRALLSFSFDRIQIDALI